MAQKVQVELVDDLDGSTAVGTTAFGLDGNVYEIDLSKANDAKLRKFLADYVEKGRKVPGQTTRRRKRDSVAGTGGINTAEVREWAKASGYKISERGRIPANIVVDFKTAKGK